MRFYSMKERKTRLSSTFEDVDEKVAEIKNVVPHREFHPVPLECSSGAQNQGIKSAQKMANLLSLIQQL